MNVHWSPIAAAELMALRDYVRERNPDAAGRLSIAIVEAAECLAAFPHRGRVGKIDGARELIVAATPVFLQYRVADGRVDILRVIHTSRDWPPPNAG